MKLPPKVIGIDKDYRVTDKWNDMHLPCITIKTGDGILYLKRYGSRLKKDCFVFIDAPYLGSTRKSSHSYAYDLKSTYEHRILLKTILKLKCMVLICTYPNDLYENMLKGWNKVSYYSTTRQGRALETFYMNYHNNGCLLQDYSFIGQNNRQRERIKKKVKRWSNRLNRLNGFERNAILNSFQAIEEIQDPVIIFGVGGHGVRIPGE